MNLNTSRRLVSIIMGAVLTVAGTIPAAAADGDLDLSFGSGGSVVTDLGSTEDGRAVAIQPDGRIILAGSGLNGTNADFALVRYLLDGTLDPTFGAAGKVYTDFGGNRFDYGRAIAIQPDGRIVVAGQSAFSGNMTDFGLARYHPDGSLDTSFDGDGKVITDFGPIDLAAAIALLPDGRIVAAGYTLNGANMDFAVARYNSDGSPDASFDGDGKVHTDFGGAESGAALAIQVDGRIVLAGSIVNPDLNISDFALVRYNSDGSLDTTFGEQGMVATDFGGRDEVNDLALQADGRIIVVGTSEFRFAVARYNSDGSLDSAFDGDGRITENFGAGNPPFDKHSAHAVAVQPDGRIIVSGISNSNVGLVRYNPDGSLDLGFGADGRVTSDLGGNEHGYDVALQPDGRIVVGGSRDVDLMLTRFENGSSTGVVTLNVAATANPWLAGMPAGTLSHFGDAAPANSPSQVPGLPLVPGTSLQFSASGLVTHGPSAEPFIETSGPDGGTSVLAHDFGPENGIADVTAPINSLMGVFLGPELPHLSSAPGPLDFSTVESRDYLMLRPALQQVFFIGDGRTRAGQLQSIVIPQGASRLFLGPMDASQYHNNTGSFLVTILRDPATAVVIDVKPNRPFNRIEVEKHVCKDDDRLLVAIISTPDFDARSVDPATLQIGDPTLGGTAAAARTRARDVDLDGDQDLAIAFDLCTLVSNDALAASSRELILNGLTIDGTPVRGRDMVQVIDEDDSNRRANGP